MNPPQISVIIPVFNVEKFLPQCLDSVTEQNFADIEIICIDDGSTDKSPEILSRYADRDPRIRIISRTNGGLSAARNAGLKIARGKYIFFIDSDDWIEPNTLEKLFATAESTGADLTCVHFRAFAETENDKRQANGKQSYFDQSEQTPEGCRPLSDNPLKIHVVVNGKLHKKSIIEKFSLSFPHERLIHEDEYWAWAYGIHCQSYSYLPDPLYHYRIHRNSITGTEKNSPRPLDIIDINLLTAEEIRRCGRLAQYLPQLENIFNRHLTSALLKSGAEHYGEARRKMAGYLQIPSISKQFKENISALAEAEIPLSVIIAVYNTAPWLACCLDSLLAQSTDLFEIICINDGSTDESPEILSRYAARDSRIRIINQQNRGLPAARNTGLAAARGKYVTFVDSDDWVEPQTMEKILLHMQHQRLDILAFRLRIYDPSTQTFRTDSYHDFPSVLPAFSLCSGKKEPELLAALPQEVCTKAYRRGFLTANKLAFCENLVQGEDEFFNLLCLPYADSYGILKEYLYNYRYPREGSIMSIVKGHEPETITGIFGLLDGIARLYHEQKSEKAKNALAARYLLQIRNLFKNYPVFENRFCFTRLRRQLKKNKAVFRGRGKLRPETYGQIKKLLRRGWFFYRLSRGFFSASQTPCGRALAAIGDFAKAYFLFPWYVYKIYKLLKKVNPF